MKKLGEFVKQNNHLETLAIEYDHVKHKGLKLLSKYLAGNTSIQTLGLHGEHGPNRRTLPLMKKIIESSRIETIEIEETAYFPYHEIFIPLAQNQLKNGSKLSFASYE